MLLEVRSAVLFPCIALTLTACQPESGSGSSANGPQLEAVHTTVLALTDDSSTIDMDMRIRLKVSDPDGFDDLNTAIFTFPNGESHNISIPDHKFERNGELYIHSYFNLGGFDLVNGQRQLPMTGYSVLIQDFSGNKLREDFSILGLNGTTVSDGTQLVHPSDFSSAGGSGGDFLSGIGIATINNVAKGVDEISVTATLNDSRVEVLEFHFDDAEGNFVAYFTMEGSDVIETDGTKTYTIPVSDLEFFESYSSTDPIQIVSAATSDKNKYTEGAFKGRGQLAGFSEGFSVE